MIFFIFYILKYFIKNNFNVKNYIWTILYGLASVFSPVEVISSCRAQKTSLLYIILPTLDCCDLGIWPTALPYRGGRLLPCFISASLLSLAGHDWRWLNKQENMEFWEPARPLFHVHMWGEQTGPKVRQLYSSWIILKLRLKKWISA